MKTCKVFRKSKKLKEFNKKKSNKDGFSTTCKECWNKIYSDYQKTKEGLVSRIYNGQIGSSKRRGFNKPNYTMIELKEWIFNQDNFNDIFNKWAGSNYETGLKPSIDRINDYDGYNLNNIKLTTWSENFKRGYKDRENGINNKTNVPVLQFDKDGTFIREYYSQKQASRELNITSQSINRSCNNNRNTAGGFIWRKKGE